MIPILMTRPLDRSRRFFAGLPAPVRAATEPVYAPMWRMEGGPPAPAFDAAIITSANGVHFGPDAEGRAAYCVGTVTTEKARAAGWVAQKVGEDAEALVEVLSALRPGGRLMHLSGARSRGDVAERLGAAGLDAHRHVTYVQHPLPLNAEGRAALGAEAVLVPLFSPDGAAHFSAEAGQPRGVHVAAISAATAAELGNLSPRNLIIAATPDAQSLGSALHSILHELLPG